MAASLVLVTGASGYIGGRLVPELIDAGHRVRVLARTPAKLAGEPWLADVEVVQGDIGDGEAVAGALAGVTAAYYLVHSMGGAGDFAAHDRRAAAAFRTAADATVGLEQIVYLGGLGDEDDAELSPHLSSRHEVGRELASGTAPVTELRAAVIIGSGSASFEMLRNLTDVLPVMITPRWVSTRCQPIAIRDVLHWLVQAIATPSAKGRILEVGGPQVVTYEDMMRAYSEVAELRERVVIRVPFLTPRLSSHWVGLVTPLPLGLARPLIESLVNEVVVLDRSVQDVMPHEPLGLRAALGWPSDGWRIWRCRPAGPTPPCRAEPPPTRCPPIPTGPAAPSCLTSRRRTARPRPSRCSRPCRASAAIEGGSSPMGCGRSAARSMSSSVGWGCAGGAVTPTICRWVRLSTSGGSRPSRHPHCSGCAPRC